MAMNVIMCQVGKHPARRLPTSDEAQGMKPTVTVRAWIAGLALVLAVLGVARPGDDKGMTDIARALRTIETKCAAFLNVAAATDAYVLSDRATWIHFGNKADLQILVQGDKRLFNQYGVMLVDPEKHPSVKAALGHEFIDYLISPEGQKDIAGYKIDGQQLFYPNARDPGARLDHGSEPSLAVGA